MRCCTRGSSRAIGQGGGGSGWDLQGLITAFGLQIFFNDQRSQGLISELQRHHPPGLDLCRFQLFPWEKFLTALWDWTYWRESGLPRWPHVLCLLGRGAGKDGYISFSGLCSVSPFCEVPRYDVDICANLEEQATRPLVDLVENLEGPRYAKKLNRHFYHTKQVVQGRKNKGSVRGRTNNPKSRDGMRTGRL